MKKITTDRLSRSFCIPDDVVRWLKRRMKESCRSMNGEVLYLLREAKEKDKGEKINI